MQQPNLVLHQKLRQEQILTPVQIQSLEILMAPVLELQAKISQELDSNPILEQDDYNNAYEGTPDSFDIIKPSEKLERGESEAESPADDDIESYNIGGEKQVVDNPQIDLPDNDFDDKFETSSLRDNFETNEPGNYTDKEKIDYFFNSIVDTKSPGEELQFQLDMLNLDEQLKPASEIIIGSLDEKGYLKVSLDDLASSSGIPLKDMERALDAVQSLDPAGVGARTLKECLLIQLHYKKIDNPILKNIIENYLDDIALNHIPRVAKELGITVEKLNDTLVALRKLSPYPYSGSTDKSEASIVIPEITIEKNREGRYEVILEEKYQPRLRISEKYLNMLDAPDTPQETKEYIRQKIHSAGIIIKSIEQRQDTIKKLAEVITDTQYDFFENGIEFLKPLTMKQVADKIGVHETTVSRAVSGKYAKTPQGVFELRYFFSSGYTSNVGDIISNKVVMEKIKDIIAAEDSLCPYSDDAITEMLNRKGIPVARRTVAKYREEMNIPSSRLRRQFS